ncbi:MAG: hypothetical protein Q4B96_04105 [Bacillota bacterium]|nr:hypothetical protein [Bacillota bacterium]
MTNKPAAKEKATFIIQLNSRQNSTWQGSLVWSDRNVSKRFRSALEMLKLIDSALNEQGMPEE